MLCPLDGFYTILHRLLAKHNLLLRAIGTLIAVMRKIVYITCPCKGHIARPGVSAFVLLSDPPERSNHGDNQSKGRSSMAHCRIVTRALTPGCWAPPLLKRKLSHIGQAMGLPPTWQGYRLEHSLLKESIEYQSFEKPLSSLLLLPSIFSFSPPGPCIHRVHGQQRVGSRCKPSNVGYQAPLIS